MTWISSSAVRWLSSGTYRYDTLTLPAGGISVCSQTFSTTRSDAMFIYWQFLAVSLGETIFNATPEEAGPAWDSAIAWSGLENAAYNFVTMISALFLVGAARRIGAKRVHAVALGLAALSLIWLARIDNQYVALIPMIGVGIFWASAVGVPYMMVASMVPARRTGSTWES